MVEMWIVGIVIMIIGCTATNFGQNLMSLGLKKDKLNSDRDSSILDIAPTKRETQFSPSIKSNNIEISSSVTYGCGLFLMVAGGILTFAAYGFGAQSLIASLESVQFICNVIFTYLLFSIQPTARIIFGTSIIIAGNILVVLYSDKTSYKYDITQLQQQYYFNLSYQIYLCLAFFFAVFFYFIFRYYERKRVLLNEELSDLEELTEATCFILYASIIGTQLVLMAKSIAMLIEITVTGGGNQFTNPITYIFIVLFVFFAWFWLSRMSMAMLMYSPIFAIPALQVFFILFAILSGGIFFEEFLTFSIQQYLGFCGGVVMIVIGVFFLLPSSNLIEKYQIHPYLSRKIQTPEKVLRAMTPDSHCSGVYGLDSNLYNLENNSIDCSNYYNIDVLMTPLEEAETKYDNNEIKTDI